MTDKLLFDVTDKIATITFNNPEKLNAFTTEMLVAYRERLEECRTREDVWAIIITGAGRGFCSGGDTGRMGADTPPTPAEIKSGLWDLVQLISLKMTEIDSKENTRRGDSSAHRYLFHGNESLSCNTPFHCPPFAHIVPPFQYHGFERSGLTDLRSPLCQRAHGLIGMYKMVYFMGCVRILWPLRPGYFKPNVERALSLEEKAFVTKFHKIGFSPIVYPPINESNSIVHIESFYN